MYELRNRTTERSVYHLTGENCNNTHSIHISLKIRGFVLQTPFPYQRLMNLCPSTDIHTKANSYQRDQCHIAPFLASQHEKGRGFIFPYIPECRSQGPSFINQMALGINQYSAWALSLFRLTLYPSTSAALSDDDGLSIEVVYIFPLNLVLRSSFRSIPPQLIRNPKPISTSSSCCCQFSSFPSFFLQHHSSAAALSYSLAFVAEKYTFPSQGCLF